MDIVTVLHLTNMVDFSMGVDKPGLLFLLLPDLFVRICVLPVFK